MVHIANSFAQCLLMEAFLYHDNLQSYFDLFTSKINRSVCENIKFFHGSFCWFFESLHKLPFINPVVSNLRTTSTLLSTYVNIANEMFDVSVPSSNSKCQNCVLYL